MTYFPEEESIRAKLGDRLDDTLAVIADRYIGQHPPLPFAFRAFSRGGFVHTADGRYHLDAAGRFPHAPIGAVLYAAAMFRSDADKTVAFALSCSCPVKVFVNGELVHRAVTAAETDRRARRRIAASAKAGWNRVCVELTKAASGFDCVFGSDWAKWFPVDFYSPFAERRGQGGWVYAEPVERPLAEEDAARLSEAAGERTTGLRWRPARDWPAERAAQSPWERLYGVRPGRAAIGWTAFDYAAEERGEAEFRCETAGALQVWMDDALVFACAEPGTHRFRAALAPGGHRLLVRSASGEDGWRGSVVSDDVAWKQPHPIRGTDETWLYAGTFPADGTIEPASLQTMYGLLEADGGRRLYWQLDRPDTWVRPYLENELFAKWNYPLGVTLYGLLRAGRLLGSRRIVDYAARHIAECASLFDYALWDRDAYGYPTVNQQLVEMDMLDDVGSFGSAMLEANRDRRDPRSELVAHRIARYIADEQERRPDGAFYRRRGAEGTLWIDDLYMSTPFLIRYYKLTGEASYLDDAARQFLLFKQYLYMEDRKIMSHVYDFHYNTATFVPWGRGNGWCLFSLSETLEALPEEHARRPQLLELFRELSAGYLALQGASGMWHQVLTHPDSYEESSCTAMFVYAFARGVRFGWYAEPAEYRAAAVRGWEALTRRAIDAQGNVHGVCRGSSYAFTADYYKHELLWTTNDTHGIGIVMLAGVEVANMRAAQERANETKHTREERVR